LFKKIDAAQIQQLKAKFGGPQVKVVSTCCCCVLHFICIEYACMLVWWSLEIVNVLLEKVFEFGFQIRVEIWVRVFDVFLFLYCW